MTIGAVKKRKRKRRRMKNRRKRRKMRKMMSQYGSLVYVMPREEQSSDPTGLSTGL